MNDEELFKESMKLFETSVELQRSALKESGRPFVFLTILATTPEDNQEIIDPVASMQCDIYDNIGDEHFDEFVKDVFAHISVNKSEDQNTVRIH